MVCGVPGTRLSIAGVAVTPDGSPNADTVTVPPKELSEFTSTEIWEPAAPLMTVADAGVTLKEKSGAGEDAVAGCIPPPPHAMIAMQQNRQARKKTADRPGRRLT
jgi:hypothetical protein